MKRQAAAPAERQQARARIMFRRDGWGMPGFVLALFVLFAGS